MALKPLRTLIKLHKRRVDVLRREMVALEEERKQLLLLASALQAEHAREMQLAAQDPQIARFFSAYSQGVKNRLEALAEEARRLDGAIEEKIEAIREEFGEQKKYEIAREHIQKRENEEMHRRQQQRFDEIGMQQHLRQEGRPV